MELRPILKKKISIGDRINGFTATMSALGFIIGVAIVVYFILKLLY